MAQLGQWSGGVVANLDAAVTWAAPASMSPTEDRNDGSIYGWVPSTMTLTLPSSDLADGYMLIGAYEFEDSSNGRTNFQGKWVQASGTGTFVSAQTGGYNRDNSEDRQYVRAFAFVDNPSASSTYQFQYKRDSDAPNTTDGMVRSVMQVVPFFYANHGIYLSTTAAVYGGTTPNLVTGFSAQDESDTNAIELVSNQITLKTDNKRFLCLGNFFQETVAGTLRTQRWAGLEVDGTFQDSMKGYAIWRNAGNDETGMSFTTILDVGATNVTVEMNAYRGDGESNGEGGATVDGDATPTNANHVMVILELHDTAEVFRTTGSGGQNLATTGPVDLSLVATADVDFADAGSFVRSSDTGMNVEVTTDVLLGANISAASQDVTSSARWTCFSEFTVDGVEESLSFGGDYLRGSSLSQDCFGWSSNQIFALAVTADEDVGVSVTELPGTEGGGGNIAVQDGWEHFWGINLDTLQPGPITATPALAITATADLEAQGKLDAAAALAFSVVADLRATGQLDAAAALAFSIVADLRAGGALDAAAALAFSIVADLRATGALDAAAQLTFAIVADLVNAAEGQISAQAALVFAAVADLKAVGDLDATATLAFAVVTDLQATGSLDAAAALAFSIVADLKATGQISAAAALVFDVVADLQATGQLDAAAALVFAVAANLTTVPVQLQAQASLVFDVVADLTADGQLDAAAALAFALVADLTADGALSATATLVLTAVADLKAAGQLDAAAQLTFAAVADLQATGGLDATADLAFSIVAVLTGGADIAAAPALAFSVVADLQAQAVIENIFANPQLTFTPTANLTARGALAANPTMQFSALAILADAIVVEDFQVGRLHIAPFFS